MSLRGARTAPLRYQRALYPEDFGAAGNGSTDDQTALTNWAAAGGPGKLNRLKPGKTYNHSAILTFGVAGTTIVGLGTLQATAEATSAVKVNANNITIDGPILKMQNTTFRGDTPAHHKLHVAPGVSGATIRQVLIDGSHAAGMFLEGASNYLVEDCTVQNSLADAFHQTAGSNNGIIRRPTAINVGDDGVAVVSYLSDGVVCHDITVESPHIVSQTHGRALSVAGGNNVTFSNITVDSSSAAALYFASETGTFSTYAVFNVTVTNGTITNANQDVTVDHGSVMIWCAQSTQTIHDVTVTGVSIANTRTTASRQMGLLVDAGSISRVTLTNIAMSGTGTPISNPLSNSAGTTAYNSSGWTINGVAQASHSGW